MSVIAHEDQRKASRKAVLLMGQIEFGADGVDGRAVFDCLVLDISESGARVRTGAPLPVPASLRLRLRSGEARPVIRRWSSGREIGFCFSPSALPPERRRFIRDTV